MFRINARKTVLALSLFAAVGAMLPGSHAASAAPIPAAESATDLQWEVEQVKPKPVLTFRKLTWEVLSVNHGVNGFTTYGFRLHAQGAPITGIQVTKKYYTQQGMTVVGPVTTTEFVGTLTDGQWKEVMVSCAPGLHAYCTEAIVSAVSVEGTSAAENDVTDGNVRTS